METYELWRMVMYALGVFVTCNVGGAALRMGARRLTRRKPAPEPERAVTRQGVRVLKNPEEIREFLSGLSEAEMVDTREAFRNARQSFEEIRRQVDGSTANPEPAKPVEDEKDFFSD